MDRPGRPYASPHCQIMTRRGGSKAANRYFDAINRRNGFSRVVSTSSFLSHAFPYNWIVNRCYRSQTAPLYTFKWYRRTWGAGRAWVLGEMGARRLCGRGARRARPRSSSRMQAGDPSTRAASLTDDNVHGAVWENSMRAWYHALLGKGMIKHSNWVSKQHWAME